MMKGKLSVFLLMIAVFALAAPALADTARVQIGAIEKTVFGTGAVQPKSQPGVYAKLDADVVSSFVSVGDTVAKGDVLMNWKTARSKRSSIRLITIWKLRSMISSIPKHMNR